MKKLSDVIGVFCLFFSVISCFCPTGRCSNDPDEQITLIREAYRDGLFETVQSLAEDYIKSKPKSDFIPELQLMLGTIDLQTGRSKSAAARFEKGRQSHDSAIQAQACYELARIQWDAHQFSEAASNFYQAASRTDLESMKAEAFHFAGLSFFNDAQWEEADRALSKAIGKDSSKNFRLAHYYRGMARLHMNQYEEAREDIEILMKNVTELDANQKSELFKSLAETEMRQGNLDSASRWAARMGSIESTPDVCWMKAIIAMKNQQWAQALVCLKETAGHMEQDRELFEKASFFIALTASQLRDTEWWVPLIEFIADHPQSQYEPFILRELLRNGPQEIPPDVAQLIVESPRSKDLDPSLLIALYLRLEQYDPAVTQVLNVIQHGPADSADTPMWIQAASIMQKAGMNADSLQILDLINNNQEIPSLSFERARLVFQSGDYPRASSLFQDWIVHNSDDDHFMEGLLWLGESYFKLENWRLSLNVFRRLVGEQESPASYRLTAYYRMIICAAKLMEWEDVLKITAEYETLLQKPDAVPSEIEYYAGLAYANTRKYKKALERMSLAMDKSNDGKTISEIKELILRIQSMSEQNQQPAPHDPAADHPGGG